MVHGLEKVKKKQYLDPRWRFELDEYGLEARETSSIFGGVLGAGPAYCKIASGTHNFYGCDWQVLRTFTRVPNIC